MAKKTTCPISRADFRAKAQAVTVTIGSQQFRVEAREFSTGSLGWYLNTKTELDVGGAPVQVQIGLNLTIIGSKELPKDDGGSPGATAPPAEDATATGPGP